MNTRVVVTFPYAGYEKSDNTERLFWQVIGVARKVDDRPLVIVNKDTVHRGRAVAFRRDPRASQIQENLVWSVDTSQMWLAGWGKVLDDSPAADRIVVLPGDIETVADEQRFFEALRAFVEATKPAIAIGDFETGDRYSAKELIDTYGTYSLLANWFAQVSQAIQQLPLRRPRSEFLNIDAKSLGNLLLEYRKFAYEQTLNMLIRSWDYHNRTWKLDVRVFDLGTFHDEKSFRQYRGALDQIERTERMLRLLWREINEPSITGNRTKDEESYRLFSNEYDRLDRVSTGIRENARVTIRALLGT